MRNELERGGRTVAVLLAAIAVLAPVVPVAAAAPAAGPGSVGGADVAGGVDVAGVPDGTNVAGEADWSTPTEPGPGGPAGIAPAPPPAVAGDLRSSGPPGVRDLANATVHNVTLVTGQTVTVVEAGSATLYRVDAGVGMRRIRTPEGTYVYPEGVDFGVYDPALFNVDRLIERGLTDAGSGSIPVIVEYSRPVPAGGGLAMAAGGGPGVFEADRTLESIDAVAGTVDKGSLRPGAGRSGGVGAMDLAPTVEGVYLDRVYEVDLNESTRAIAANRARRQFDVDGSGVRVAVLDTGVSDTHPDLDGGTVVAERDFTDEGTVEDDIGHGTHVASIVAGDGEASNGTFRGVAPGASIMNLRVLDSDGRGRASWIIDGIEYAVNNSADVVSMSLGGRPTANSPLARATNSAVERGVVMVVAAGNAGPDSGTIATPGIARRAITVGATDDSTGGVATFSSRGPTAFDGLVKPDVTAPGVAIRAACVPGSYIGCPPGSEYVNLRGTSMATPHVSGVVALMLDAHPDWSPARVKDALTSTASPVSGVGATVYDAGAGTVNATRALDPGIVVENASMSLGQTQRNRTITRVVTLHNRGDEPRALSASAEVVEVETHEPTGDAALNVSRVVVPAGGSAHVELTVEVDGPKGVYSGRIDFRGQRRSYTAVFGYTRAERVVVEKRPLGDTSVEGDEVWVFPHAAGVTARVLEIDDGTVSFFALQESNYTVLSPGTDESTGGPVLMYEVANETDRITLDESATVPYRLDAGELRAEHGPLVNLSRQAELRAGVFFALTVLDNFTATRRIRFSEQSTLEAVVEYVLAPADRYDAERERKHLDTPDLYHLVYATRDVDGPETFRADPSRLGTDHRRYFRSDPAQRLRLAQEVLLENVTSRWSDAGYWWNLSGRSEQTVYLSPDNATYYVGVSLPERGESPAESPTLVGVRDPSPGETLRTHVNRGPYTPLSAWSYDGWLVFEAFFQTDQPPGRFYYYDPEGTSEIAVRIDDETVFRRALGDSGVGFSETVDSGTEVNVTLVSTTPGRASGRTVTEYRNTLERRPDAAPPRLGRVRVEGINDTGAVRGGETTLTVNFSSKEDVDRAVVLYAPGDVRTVPLRGGTVGDAEGWTRADVVRINATAFEATVEARSERTSIAVLGVDEEGDSVAVTVFDAIHAPSAESAVPELADYANDEDVVDDAGLSDAIRDWAAGDVSTEFLGRVIRAWASGRPVV